MKRSPEEIWNKISPVLLRKYKRDKTFLDYRNSWELLVAVILSAQTTDEGVNKVTPKLFQKWPHPHDLMNAKISEIAEIIHSIGYYNSKARYIKEAARMLVEEFEGIVPDNEELLMKLPGVGRKTAVAVISNAFNKNIGIPVDTHVIRFVDRFGLTKAKDPSKIEQDLLRIIPKKDWKRAGYAIKEYGRKEGRARGYEKENDPLVSILDDN